MRKNVTLTPIEKSPRDVGFHQTSRPSHAGFFRESFISQNSSRAMKVGAQGPYNLPQVHTTGKKVAVVPKLKMMSSSVMSQNAIDEKIGGGGGIYSERAHRNTKQAWGTIDRKVTAPVHNRRLTTIDG